MSILKTPSRMSVNLFFDFGGGEGSILKITVIQREELKGWPGNIPYFECRSMLAVFESLRSKRTLLPVGPRAKFHG